MPPKKKSLNDRQQVMLDFAEAAAEEGQHFYYVLIREPLGPFARDEKYGDPLAKALGELGEITGGGSQLGEGNSIEYCGLDVVVNDRARGLAVIQKCLRECGAPDDMLIEEYIPQFNELTL